MIYGHGIDIVHLHRFYEMDDARILKLADRILTNSEMEHFNESQFKRKILYLAKIWAAKEAISKSFKTGIRDDVIWQNIEVSNDDNGSPTVTFKNELSNTEYRCQLSISHDGDYVIASAILGT